MHLTDEEKPLVRRLLEWLEGRCTEHEHYYSSIRQRFDCGTCMKELRSQLEGDDNY